MTMESFATPYPVLFSDGEIEHDKGHVGIHSVLSFKKFQSHMSRLIGVPANQLSTVFVCRRTPKDTGKRQKLPINETTNFNIILNQHNPSRERDCHFLASIKKSKKERKGTRKRSSETDNADEEDSTSSTGDPSPSDERPKTGTDSANLCFNEAASPNSILQRPVSPVLSSSEIADEQVNLEISANAKNLPARVDKPERVLLRREGVSQSTFASATGMGWPFVGPGHRVEGFDANAAGTNTEFASQNLKRPPLTQDENWKTEKAWIQEGISGRRPETVMFQPVQTPSFMSSVSRADLFKQGRFTDSALPQCFGMRPPPAPQRIGAAMNHLRPFPDLPIRPILSRFEGSNNIMPRNVAPTPNPMPINAGFQQPNKNALMLRPTQTPITNWFPVYASAERPNLNGGMHGSCQINVDRKEDAQPYTYRCHFCCENRGSAPFHFCVNDRILSGFRGPSIAGPITRPHKNQVEVSA